MHQPWALAAAIALCACNDVADHLDPPVLAGAAARQADGASPIARAAVEAFTAHEIAGSFSREKAAAPMADTPDGF